MDKKQETSYSEAMINAHNRKRTFAQACKECNAISMDEFVAEWMRQLELRFKNTSDNSELPD